MLDALVLALVQAGAPGAAACVADGDTEFVAAAGDAEPDGVFGIGSVTKTFVAATVLRLAADRVLELDQPAARWCDLAPHDVTIRMLMNHTSRIPDYIRSPGFLDRVAREPRRIWSPRELVSLVNGREPMWRYSNTNSILLGLVVEAATGQPLEDALGELVLEPLDLHATRLPGVGERMPDPSFAWAAGAMESTPREVARFLCALLRGDLVDTPELRRTVDVDDDEFDRYGLGIAVMSSILRFADSTCGPAWGHLGLGLDSTTAALATEDGRRGVVICVTGALDEAGWRALADRVWPIFCGLD